MAGTESKGGTEPVLDTEETATAATATAERTATGDLRTSGRKESLAHRLYAGSGAFDIVGKRARFYAAFGVLVLVCIGSMVFRGFNPGIEFVGGTTLQMPAVSVSGAPISTEQASKAFDSALNMAPASVQLVGSGASASIEIRSQALTTQQTTTVKDALTKQLTPRPGPGQQPDRVVSDNAVSSTWGQEISQKALIALAVFLVLVTAFLAFYFEWQMAVSALVALVHDLVVTAGVYSLVGFEVTPATVIGLLTILGFSLYDTVVVFDKIRENSRGLLGLTRRTYGETANLALNQTLMRSINTSLIALLPVIGLLIVGVGLLGVGTLADLALVQLIGMLSGAVSSLFLATPLLVDLKMRDPKFRQQHNRVLQRRKEQAAKAARPTGDGGTASLVDQDEPAAETRRERAYASASTSFSPASAPARTPKASDARRAAGRPTGKPSGKKRR